MMYGLKMMSHLLTNLSECVLGPLGIDRTGDTGGGGVHYQGGQTLYLSLHVQHKKNDTMSQKSSCGYHQFPNPVCANHIVK